MTWDIVFPRNNEKEYIELAQKLGYSGLVFCYTKDPVPVLKTDFPHKSILLGRSGVLRVVASTETIRGVIERKHADLIYNFEVNTRKDYIHHRASGMNHVIAELLRKKEIVLGVAFSTLLHADPYKRGVLMGRIQQNVQLCRKYKVPIVVASFATRPLEMRSPHDLEIIGTKLGMHPQEVKQGQMWLTKKVLKN